MIFQHRSKNKDTYPDKLDATVSGHVEIGMSYDETVIKECKEETGIDLSLNDLIFIKKVHCKNLDKSTGLINNSIRAQYVYLFKGDTSELKIEPGASIGFEKRKIESLYFLSKKEKEKFIPNFVSKKFLMLFKDGQKRLNLKVN